MDISSNNLLGYDIIDVGREEGREHFESLILIVILHFQGEI